MPCYIEAATYRDRTRGGGSNYFYLVLYVSEILSAPCPIIWVDIRTSHVSSSFVAVYKHVNKINPEKQICFWILWIDEPCITNDNVQGTCIDLKRCKNLHDLVANKIARTPQTEEFFRKNKCGWNNNEPKVCCSDTPSSLVDVDNTLTSRGSKTKSKPADCGKSSKNAEKIFGGRPAELGEYWVLVSM